MDILEFSSLTANNKQKTNLKQAAKMKMSKVGNQTNSQDPQAVNSRVFVGNLNTFQCSKTDVERMFQRYGRLAGISMHKGYAFVQFTNPFDARSACLGEDGRTILSQILDVNMVAEPKPHQTGRKRQNVAKTGNDWDYYYDSYYASTAFPVGPPRLAPPLKRQRLMSSTQQRVNNNKGGNQNGNGAPGGCLASTNNTTLKTREIPPLDQLKVYSNPDILICGNCREMFTDLHDILDHKKSYCKMRFTCKCDSYSKPKSPVDDQSSSASLLCVQCKDAFHSAWDLMVHAQAAHMLNIYELGVPALENCNGSPPLSPRDNNTPDKDKLSALSDHTTSGTTTTTHSPDYHLPDFVENGREPATPDSAHSSRNEDLPNHHHLMDTSTTTILTTPEATPSSTNSTTTPPSTPPTLDSAPASASDTCIMHALSIVSAAAAANVLVAGGGGTDGGGVPPLAAVTAPMDGGVAAAVAQWQLQHATGRLASAAATPQQLRHEPY